MLTAAPLEKAQALSERVYRAVLKMLARGGLERGATLRIDELAKALDVSPTPVREALARLATTGLVMHEARKGYTVAPPLSHGQLAELMDARQLIEVAAIGRACATGGARFAAALQAAFDAQRAAVDAFHAQPAGAMDEEIAWALMDSDMRFHQVIFDGAGNRFILVMAGALSAQLHRVRQSAERGISDDLQALSEHEAILKAVLSGERAAAEEAMNIHMDLLAKRAALDLEDGH